MTTRDADAARVRAEELLLSNLPVIDAIVGFIARRHHLPSHEAEELRSQVRFKLVDDDYAVLRKFRGTSSLRTYLTTVIQHVFLDERVRSWGRWRPSIFARRSGPVAVLFEKFVVRDHRSFDEACALLESHGISADLQTLRRLHEQMPVRARPHVVQSDVAADTAAPGTSEDELLDSERTALASRAAAALRAAVSLLPPRQRLIVQLRFEQGLRVADIARALSEDQKALYREFERLTIDLRASLEAEGLNGSEISELLGHSRVDFGDVLRESRVESPLDVRLKPVRRAKQQRESL